MRLRTLHDDLEFLNKRALEEEQSKPQDQRSELGLDRPAENLFPKMIFSD
jgi:hypothetical protein